MVTQGRVFLETLTVTQPVKNAPDFIELEGSSPFSQNPTIKLQTILV
jgi:hypothetical protein